MSGLASDVTLASEIYRDSGAGRREWIRPPDPGSRSWAVGSVFSVRLAGSYDRGIHPLQLSTDLQVLGVTSCRHPLPDGNSDEGERRLQSWEGGQSPPVSTNTRYPNADSSLVDRCATSRILS